MGLRDDLIVGVSVNNVTGITGKRYELPDLFRSAREAEAMGFGAIWVHDAMFGRRTVAAYDPVAVLSAVAGMTKKLRLCTGILAPRARNAIQLALQWATLDAISEGRTIMGVGLGAGTPALVHRQFAALAALRHDTALDPDRLFEGRSRLFEECLEVMRRLWAEDKVSYEGTFYRFRDMTLGQARPPAMPAVLVAAGIYYPKEPGGPVHHAWQEKYAGKFVFGPYRRVADLGDGWLTNHLTPEQYEHYWGRIDAYARERYPDRHYLKAFNCFVHVGDDRRAAWQAVKDHLNDFHGPPIADDVVDRWAVAGPAEEVAEKLQAYIDRGVTIFQLVIGSPDQLGQMRKIAEGVLPRLRPRSR